MLWLVGLMGSGKSTIGPLAAELLGVAFLDTDVLVERRSGRTIPDLFREGEAAFRDVESSVLEDVASGAPAVVATGGGAVLREANSARMRGVGTVLWLRAAPETLAARIGEEGGRPLLEGGTPADRLTVLADERRSAYAAAADVVLDTDSLSIEEVVQEVVAAWPAS